jgi:hypothetical protein
MQGKLDEFIEEHDWAMMESYDPGETILQAQKAEQEAKAGLKTLRDVNAALSRLTEETLTTWLEFSDPRTTGSPQGS